jgi:hypothetical protein
MGNLFNPGLVNRYEQNSNGESVYTSTFLGTRYINLTERGRRLVLFWSFEPCPTIQITRQMIRAVTPRFHDTARADRG